MSSGTNWVASLKSEAAANPSQVAVAKPPSGKTEGGHSGGSELTVYRLIDGRWGTLKDELKHIKLREIVAGPYLIKNKTKYVCGNLEVYDHLKDKEERVFSADYLAPAIAALERAGLATAHVMEMPFSFFLRVCWVQKVFKGKFLTGRGEECSAKNKQQYQKSIWS